MAKEGPRLEVFRGDITTLDVDAIVNAANSALRPGGGVCGAIHRAAGPKLAEACAAVGGCATGDARATEGFRLRAKWVIHTVGPVWAGGTCGEDGQLASCYRMSLKLARERRVRSIAFPAISTGVYGYPLLPAAKVAVAAVQDFLARSPAAPSDRLERIVFCVFDEPAEQAYREALKESPSVA